MQGDAADLLKKSATVFKETLSSLAEAEGKADLPVSAA